MNKQMVILVLGMFVASWSLAACNTTAGVGKDIESTGDAIDDAATEAK